MPVMKPDSTKGVQMNIKLTSRQKGVLLLILSSFSFALMNVFVRLSGSLPSAEKSFFRNLVALLTAWFMIYKSQESLRYEKKDLKNLILRSVCGTVGILCNYYAVDNMLLADATAIQKLVPFITIVSSAVLLTEKIKTWQAGLVIAAFLASLLVVKPGYTASLIPALIQVVGALGAGIAYTYVRILGLQGVAKAKIIFFFSAFSCAAMIPLMIGRFVMPDAGQLLCLLTAGACASAGQFSITYAYGFAPASQISIYDYSQIIFSALFGFFFFGQQADLYSWIGYALLVGIAVTNFLLQNRKG